MKNELLNIEYYSLIESKNWYEDTAPEIVLKPLHLLDDDEVFWLFESWTYYFPCPLALRMIYEQLHPADTVLVTEDDTAIQMFIYDDNLLDMLSCNLHAIWKGIDFDPVTVVNNFTIEINSIFIEKYMDEPFPITDSEENNRDVIDIFPIEELDFFDF